jgi:uncharacterized FAD-dependent dehydrogenase
MLKVRGPEAAITSVTDLKKEIKETFETAQEMPVYVTSGNRHVGTIISPEMTELLVEALADRALYDVASSRLEAIRAGEDQLLDEDDFWAHADRVMARKK